MTYQRPELAHMLARIGTRTQVCRAPVCALASVAHCHTARVGTAGEQQ